MKLWILITEGNGFGDLVWKGISMGKMGRWRYDICVDERDGGGHDYYLQFAEASFLQFDLYVIVSYQQN